MLNKTVAFLIFCVAILHSLFAIATENEIKPKAVYGTDNRQDVYEVKDPLFQQLSHSIVAMILTEKLSPKGDMFEITGRTLLDKEICSDQPYVNQIIAAHCSGALVGPDLILTAGHCMYSKTDCSDYSWVFDYKISTSNQVRVNVPASSVYRCKEVVSSEFTVSNDYALVRLDRPVTDRTPLKYRKTGAIAVNQELVTIGFPQSLPMKITDKATVISSAHPDFFVTDLDSFKGSSGSSVFDAHTGEIEGILVRGTKDLVNDPKRNCMVLHVCPRVDPKSYLCSGEEATRITNVKFP